MTAFFMRDSDHCRSILFLAGDLSGDAYSARLAQCLAERHPGYMVHALGGKNLGRVVKKTGGVWISDTTNCSAIGLTVVFRLYFWARWMQCKMRRFVRAHPIDAVVLCDWGGFNCRQLDFFNEEGIPVLFYFPPRSWQRTGNAGLQFAPRATRVATPFSWSADRLNSAGGRAEWVGHPLLETMPEPCNREALRREFGVEADEKLIALLPGSRMSEIRVLGPRLAAVAAALSLQGPIKFVVPVPAPLMDKVRRYFPPAVKILVDRSADALRACDAAVVKTGSATLEAVVAGAPQVTVYDLGWAARIEWVLLWMWKRIPFIAMPNIILQRMLVPELLGLNCRTATIAAAVRRLLESEEDGKAIASGYEEIRVLLGGQLPLGATERTVEILEEMLQQPDEPGTASPCSPRP